MMPPRKLLVFTENYLRGGGNRYCVDLANGLAPRFDKVTIAANAGALFPEDLARLAPGVQVRATPFVTRSRARHSMRSVPRPVRAPALALMSVADPLLMQANLSLFAKLIRKEKANVVICCNGGFPAARANLAMVLAAKHCGVPAVLSVVSVPAPRPGGAGGRYDALLDRRIWKSVRLVVVNAGAISRALSAERDMPPSLARTVYNGLPDAAHPDTPRRAVVGFIGRMDRAKGPVVLLDAFRQLAGRWPELQLHLVGQGDASADLARLVAEYGLGETVQLTGFIAGDVDEVLASFGIYAFASFHEGLPYSILEAMRAACPIVATRVGGIPEILEDGRDALLVEPGDVRSLAAAIDRLMADGKAAAGFGRAARARFEERHLLDRMSSRIVSVFSEAGLLSDTESSSPKLK